MLAVEALRKLIGKITKKQYFIAEFDLEEKFLELLASQKVFWISLYFCPFLTLISPVFYLVKFYIFKVNNFVSLLFL
jgi:hypothetical protein